MATALEVQGLLSEPELVSPRTLALFVDRRFAVLTAAPQSILYAGGSPQHGELNHLVEIVPRIAPGPGQRGSERLAQAPD